MICKECKNRPIVRGIKQVKCFKCGSDTYVNGAYSNICNDCSDTYLICQYCGKYLGEEIIVELKTLDL